MKNLRMTVKKGKNMSNYLKKILLSLLILMMPYMNSVSEGMNNEEYDRSNNTCRMRVVNDDQKDVSSSVKQSTSSQVVSLEDSKVSWASYLSSPVKSVLHGAYEIVEFAIQRPKIAVFIGLSYMIPAVGACACFCWSPQLKVFPIGSQANSATCSAACSNYGGQIHLCVGKDL